MFSIFFKLVFFLDIHLPGPPGSWVIHPAGYASFTNPNGITYFLDYNPPVMTPIQQPQVRKTCKFFLLFILPQF